MATVVRNDSNGAMVGIIIAVLAIGLLVAYLLGAFPGTAPARNDTTTIIEKNRTDSVPAPAAPSQPSSTPSQSGQ
jgi:hypothetical protein